MRKKTAAKSDQLVIKRFIQDVYGEWVSVPIDATIEEVKQFRMKGSVTEDDG